MAAASSEASNFSFPLLRVANKGANLPEGLTVLYSSLNREIKSALLFAFLFTALVNAVLNEASLV